jgi:exopolyphosphatase/pppGpp-phosphohydrolase
MTRIASLQEYVRRVSAPCVGIFDIGTRASRLLVAPRKVPDGIVSKQTFFNDADLSQLGADVDKNNKLLPLRESRGIERVVDFIKTYREAMRRLGISSEDIHATGTAVFRWLSEQSQEEVLAYVRERSDVAIRVIPDHEEAHMSLAGICQSRKWRPGGPRIEEEDRIVLLDQGGGSMEVSYISPKTDVMEVHSFDKLGTIALRNKFFTTDKDGKPVNPESNQSGIKSQTKRITEFIDSTIQSWESYAELNGRTIHAYALGSAITDCFPNASGYEVHNRTCTVQRMNEIVEETCSHFETTTSQVMSVYKALKGLKGKGTKGWEDEDVESQLLTLYGLPVYIKVLERFGLSEVRVCGYGLRYGFYVWTYHFLPQMKAGRPTRLEPGSIKQETVATQPDDRQGNKPQVAAVIKLVGDIEAALHDVVIGILKRTGADWWNLVPEEVRVECVTRREKDKGRDPPHAYINLIDYKDIIKKQWRLFEGGFRAIGRTRGKNEAVEWIGKVNGHLRNPSHHATRRQYHTFSDKDVSYLEGIRQDVVRLAHALDIEIKCN